METNNVLGVGYTVNGLPRRNEYGLVGTYDIIQETLTKAPRVSWFFCQTYGWYY